MPLLRCVAEPECTAILMEVHEGFCGGHTKRHSLAQEIIKQGYFWPILKHDVIEYVKKSDKCQRFSNFPGAPPIELTTMSSLWPFAVWGIDLIGSLPVGKERVNGIVDVDYFTKWTEAEALTSIIAKKSLDFVIKNIVCRFGLPRKIVSDNETQFESDEFTNFCEHHGIIKSFSSVAHP